MAFPLLAAGIGAAGSLLSGIMGNKAADKANKQQIAAIQAANRRAEKLDATKIQRVVADAKMAGIHPMAALGSPVAGSFATPQAAYGGQPRSGSAIGDAMETFGQSVASIPSSTPLQDQLTKAQIANVQASTANLISEATSRTQIANARLGGQSLSTAGSSVGAWEVMPRRPGAAQKAQDDYGDIWEQLFGTANIGSIQGKAENMGPVSREFWRYWLGNDLRLENK